MIIITLDECWSVFIESNFLHKNGEIRSKSFDWKKISNEEIKSPFQYYHDCHEWKWNFDCNGIGLAFNCLQKCSFSKLFGTQWVSNLHIWDGREPRQLIYEIPCFVISKITIDIQIYKLFWNSQISGGKTLYYYKLRHLPVVPFLDIHCTFSINIFKSCKTVSLNKPWKTVPLSRCRMIILLYPLTGITPKTIVCFTFVLMQSWLSSDHWRMPWSRYCRQG